MTAPTVHASRKTKKTHVGEVPVDWTVTRLEKLANIVRGSSPRPAGSPLYFNGNYLPWITVGDVTRTQGMYLNSTDSFLTEEGAKYTRIIEPGTLVLTNSGATLGVPKITRIRAGANDGVAAFLDVDGTDKEFLYYFLESKTRYCREILAPGVGQPNLNTELIGEIMIALPPLPEQQRIAALLKTWDRAIDRQEQLLTVKQQLKQALIQQLLSGKRRFPEFSGFHWTKMKIGEFTRPAQRVVKKPDKPFKALGIRSHCKGTFLKKDFDPAAIEMTELFEVRKNDLIVNITFAWEGAIAIAGAEDDGALVSHRFPTYVFNTEQVTPEYFRHVIVQRPFVLKLGLISPGGAGRNRVLSKRDFAKLEVLIPPLPEQQRIAAVLNDCDWEIQLLQRELIALKDQKRGLMQKLLAGEVRIRA